MVHAELSSKGVGWELNEDYFPDAHSNDNISTGAPLNARLTVRHEF